MRTARRPTQKRKPSLCPDVTVTFSWCLAPTSTRRILKKNWGGGQATLSDTVIEISLELGPKKTRILS